MDNYLLEIIKSTTEYIENNILEPLNLDNISENVNISKFHLLRIWKGATSTGLMEYVRRRRIALSLGDLIHNQNSIEFISSKYSFGCERTYNRVFKEEFKITPAKWRRNPCPLEILDRFNADFMNCSGEGLVFFRSITVLPAFSIAGLQYNVDIEENLKFQIANKYGVDFFYNHRLRVFNPIEKDVYIGFTTVLDELNSYTLYQPSIQISENSIIPEDMNIKSIIPHKYGVFTYMGLHRPEEISSKNLLDIWNHVFNIWMPTVEFDLREKFRFEYINYAKCNKHYCECDLFFPISVL
ncbi:helix-turn-helix domain-containing protein [Clostridium sp. MSJ-4]|uniref:Helix-turn-helix domain-containing protein n=1 Tax=Clostridium simiarum TaxID=2841506 RepID=A0ABS6F497_9CLOT|nr:helix-turn-helix domain-containing protein [Clostridium simiarum]MBU5593337.1 helix-turn-helix domain-containing protein [Clostridium simiarum]